MKQLLIRADAGGKLGSGHIMRMIGLSQAWISKGGRVTVVTVQCPETLVKRIEAEGISHVRLNTRDIASKADAAETISLAKQLGCEWIVLDGYGFDFKFQQSVGAFRLKVAVMDDYGHTHPWWADLIINQHPASSGTGYENLCKSGKILFGTDYVMLRKEFWEVRAPDVYRGRIRTLLISMGGVDADNLSGSVIHALNEVVPEPLKLRVIVGGGNPHLETLKTTYRNSPHSIEYLFDVNDMTEMYEWADAVITAAGGTVWEWLLYGHCGGLVVAAKNQEGLADWLVCENLASQVGYLKSGKPWIDKSALKNWLNAHALRHFNKGKHSFDGKGAIRVVEHMQAANLRL